MKTAKNTAKERRIMNSKPKPIFEQLKNTWEYRDLIFLFVKRDFITHYKQTVLGPLWYLISPIVSTIMYIIVFGNVAQIGTDGIPQPLFYFLGTTFWTFFSELTIQASHIFNDNKAIFGKVYFPRLVVPIALSFGSYIKLILQFIFFLFTYCFFIIKGSCPFCGFQILFIPFVTLWISSIALGFGLLITSITTKYRDLAMILPFIVNLSMYATPVVYPFSQVPKTIRLVFSLNPASVPFEMLRIVLFNAGNVSPWMVVYSLTVSCCLLLLGLICFTKNEQKFIDFI